MHDGFLIKMMIFTLVVSVSADVSNTRWQHSLLLLFLGVTLPCWIIPNDSITFIDWLGYSSTLLYPTIFQVFLRFFLRNKTIVVVVVIKITLTIIIIISRIIAIYLLPTFSNFLE